MACQYVAFGMGDGLMRQDEWRLQERPGVPACELLPRVCLLTAVMVSNNDIDSQTSMGLAPNPECVQEAIAGLRRTVKEIAENDEPRAGIGCNEPGQPLQVNVVLAEMRIGDDERGASRPQHSALRM